MNLDPPIPSSHVTLERLDPLAAAAARPVTTGAALLALTVPAVMITVRVDEITQPAWLVVAYAALFAAVWILLNRSHPTRPVWQTPSAQVFHVLLAIMLMASAASTLGANAMMRDDWGPIVVGILLVATTPYRPAREIALWTAVHTLICAVLGIVQSPFAVSDFPTLTYAVTGSVAVAVMGFTAAAYARSLTHSTQLWQTRAWHAAAAAAVDRRPGVARSVQQERVSLLNREVVPYLQRVVAADTLSEHDRDEARRLASSIRSLLVADVERSWAQLMLDELVATHPSVNIQARADDPENLGSRAVLERRTLMRALAVISLERLAATELDLYLSAPDGRLRVVWSVATPRTMVDARRALRSMIELIRGVTLRSSVHERAGRLVIECECGY
ncbi:MAG: hypothetical protein C0444_07810 [Microbacterium sp.]|nr:hypothetical protein [Microbacterium sp.]MBA4345995.1 hypothetical protein [Microbacterium sp.]